MRADDSHRPRRVFDGLRRSPTRCDRSPRDAASTTGFGQAGAGLHIASGDRTGTSREVQPGAGPSGRSDLGRGSLYRFKTTRMVSDLRVHEISYAAW
jgi:hypothetical protein